MLERKLPELDIRLLVELPAGLDYNEWLASHSMHQLINVVFAPLMSLFLAMSLFDHVNLVYGTISEFCTSTSCPDMTGPGQR